MGSEINYIPQATWATSCRTNMLTASTLIRAFALGLTHNSSKYLEWNLAYEKLKGFFLLKYAI